MKTACYILTLLSTFSAFSQSSRTISPLCMGQNYWYTNWYDAHGNNHTKLSVATWSAVIESGPPALCRIGGKAYSVGSYDNVWIGKPEPGQEIYYVAMADDIRSHGSDPVLTVPFLLDVFNKSNGGEHVEPAYTHSLYVKAVDESVENLKTILRLTNAVHKRNLRYIILANEADLDYHWTTDPNVHANSCTLTSNPCTTLTAAQIASNIAGYVKPMSDAIREMVNEIGVVKIIGPGYSHCLPEVYNLLFTPSNTATYIGGTSSVSGQPYLDYIAYNFYGPDYGGSSYSNYVPPYSDWQHEASYCNIERYYKMDGESPNSARRYRGSLRYMTDLMARCNTGRPSSQQLGFMITELNSGLYNTSTLTPNTASAAASGSDAISMQGAQNLARMYALAMEYGATSSMMWSIRESGEDRGYIVGQTQHSGAKRPSWFHYKMLADYFKGTYYRDEVFAKYTTSSGTSDQISDDSPTNEPNPRWLHFNQYTGQTALLGGTTYSLWVPSDFKNHLKLMCETKAFAAQGADIAVMILNHSASTQSVVLRFDGTTPTSGAANYKRFSFAMGKTGWNDMVLNTTPGGGWDAAIDPNSTHVLIIDCATGGVKKRFRYRLGHEASTYDVSFDPIFTNTASTVYTITAVPSNTCMQPATGAAITVMGAPAGSSSYTWYKPPATQPLAGVSGSVLSPANYTAISPGIYQAVVTSTDLCQQVTVSAMLHLATPLVEAGKSLTFCPGTSTAGVLGSTLLATSNYGGYTYTWSPPGTVYSATLPVNNTSVTSSQYFTLTATDGSNCAFSDKVFIEVEDDIELLIRDDIYDVGQIPTPSTPPWVNQIVYPPWLSPDVFANYTPGATLGDALILPGTTAYAKVRVHNKGCQPLLSPASVSLYFSAAAVGTNWSSAWVNYACSSLLPSSFCVNTPSATILCGDLIGTQNTPTIAAGGSAIVEFTWSVPPDYTCAYPGHKSGFKSIYFNNWTLKALVQHTSDPLSNLTTNAYYNITHDNNVAAKKVVNYAISPVVQNDPSGIYIYNDQIPEGIRLEFVSRKDYNNETVLNYGDPVMFFPNEFLQQWIDNGQQGEGVVLLSDTSVQIISENAYMDGFPLAPQQVMPAGLMVFPTQPVDLSGGDSFDFDLILMPPGEDADSIIGGITYRIMKDEWECPACDGSTLRQSFTTTQFQDDSIYVVSDFTVSSGQTRTYERCVLRFGENTGITVEPGGKLVLKNCRLEAACKHQQWNGIYITGAVNGFTAESCNFRNTATPITATNAEGLVIRNSAFIGISQSSGSAIRLQNSGSFDISYNHIARFAEGISTSQTFTTQAANTIERNVFQMMETCIRSQNDDHRNTAILCNTFRYGKYGIYADSTDFSDFGSAQQPAGNRFKGKSQLAFHKVNQHGGNTPSYYFSALLPDSTGMNISAVPATQESFCYPGDSASSASSRVTALTKHRNAEFGLKAIPNPGNGEMLIVVSFGDAHNGILLIRDSQGRLIEKYEMNRSAPERQLNWNSRARGLYFATLELPSGQKAHTKIILQE